MKMLKKITGGLSSDSTHSLFSPSSIDDYWTKLKGTPGESISDLEIVGSIGYRKRYKNGTIYFHSSKLTCAYVTGQIESYFFNQDINQMTTIPITDSCLIADGGIACATSDDKLLFSWNNGLPKVVNRQVSINYLGVVDGHDPNGFVHGQKIRIIAGALPISKPDKTNLPVIGPSTRIVESVLPSANSAVNSLKLSSSPPFGAILFTALFNEEEIMQKDERIVPIANRLNAFSDELTGTLKENYKHWYDPSLINDGLKFIPFYVLGITSLLQQTFQNDPFFVGMHIKVLTAKEMVNWSLNKQPGYYPSEEFRVSVSYSDGRPGKYDVLFYIDQ